MSSKLRDLLQTNGKKEASSAPAKRRSGELADFLQQVSRAPVTTASNGGGRLVFALDATASREPTWDQAMQLQAEMFRSTQSLGGLMVQLCYFRGFAEFKASPWCADASGLLQQMTGIHCEAGITKIERLLRHCVQEAQREKLNAVIYIGDCVEENIDVLAQLAGELGMRNVPLFIFQEGEDPLARRAFQDMARLSRGAYCRFDRDSVTELRDLLRAVAVYASGGLTALENFSRAAHPAVRLLGQQLK